MSEPSNNVKAITAKLNDAITSGTIDVPVLPETAHRVIVLTQNPDSDSIQLANIIQTDPTLGGHVMRIANSAAYSPNVNVVSIQQAVSRLGMNEISNIALSTSLNSTMFNAPLYEHHISIIWQHALATALYAKEVARSTRNNVEAAFLCGLLHSIAKPVILQAIADFMPKETKPLDDEVLDTLFNEFESRYCEIVCREWDLPDIVAETISFHKNYDKAPSYSELAATIAFSSLLASLMLTPTKVTREELMNSPTLDTINLYPDEVNAIIEKEAFIKTQMDTLSI